MGEVIAAELSDVAAVLAEASPTRGCRRGTLSSLRQYFVHAQFRHLFLVMRNRQVIAVQFRHQDARLCAECGGDVSDAIVVVSIFLLEHVEEFGSGKIDALALAVECHVVDHGRGGITGHDLARIRIQNNQFSGNASTQKQAMCILVEGH